MPITRTTMIDDDGSGTTGTVLNNAWLQTIYGQIDAFATPTYGTWTPTDGSGAALAFTSASGTWAKYGRLAFLWFQVIYPATANAAQAKIGGFPLVCRVNGAAAQGYGSALIWYVPINASEVQPHSTSSGVTVTNAEMSGRNVILACTYLTD